MVEIVNIVASGHFGREFDLVSLATDLDAVEVQYEPETFPGMQLRFESGGPVVMIYSTGSYTVMGLKSEQQLADVHERVSTALAELGIDIDSQKSQPEIQNLICKGCLGCEVDLEALVVGLGLENTEYEPEQSPFVYYWPRDFGCLITIPTNGEVIVTGVEQVQEAEEALDHLHAKVESIIGGENRLN